MTDYPDISLEPVCCAGDENLRCWGEGHDPSYCDHDRVATHYVRADRFEALQKENAQLQAQIDRLRTLIRPVLEQVELMINDYCSNDSHRYSTDRIEILMRMLDEDSDLYTDFEEYRELSHQIEGDK